jgi:hypothetical protein
LKQLDFLIKNKSITLAGSNYRPEVKTSAANTLCFVESMSGLQNAVPLVGIFSNQQFHKHGETQLHTCWKPAGKVGTYGAKETNCDPVVIKRSNRNKISNGL